MSDNILQFPGGSQKPPENETKKPKKPLGTFIWRLVGILVFVLVVVALYAFRDNLNFDQLSRNLDNINAQAEDHYGAHNFGTHSTNRYVLYGDGMAVATVSGLELYDENSNLSEKLGSTMSNPAIYLGNKAVLSYDIGGTNLVVADFDMEALLEMTAKGQILDGDLSSKDYLVCAYASDANKTVITVYNAKMESFYRWYSSTQYMPLCTINSDGSVLAATALGQANGMFQTDLCLFDTSQEDMTTTVPLGNQTYFDLEFVSDQELVAIGENSAQFLDAEGTLNGTYDYEGRELIQFLYWDDGSVTLSLQSYTDGNTNIVVTLDGAGNVLAETTVDGVVVSISNAGNYLAVLTTETLQIFRSDLTGYATKHNVIGTSVALMESDGSCILISGGLAEIYLP